ncbi:SDR family NAD(P)-dependent oxidoreductase [Phenylobacterium montanum]|uniref:D-xylose 1-dehydrogenase n=1 Tax=Phenylobacterium montanum TaxID=2823693 RepID=A0A975G4N8_9CAUL|nr:SDR family oxidoreductase [Caulobacter sp. S6]QUD90518.1 SDR family oxidoreductase [Caulobacter sp. S6]
MSGSVEPAGKFDGRVVVVTGATKGIGRATALTLAGEGAVVIATGRDEAGGAETLRLIEEAGGAGVFLRQDVTREADWDMVMAEAERRGGLYGLVNNAGLFFVKPIEDTSADDFDRICGVNVEGCFLGLRAAFRSYAAARRGGAIVNVSSLMGLVGFPQASAYCATKGAITAMTKAAALDGAAMSPKVRVNSLHPGVIWTEMITDQFGDSQDLADAFAADTPLRMVGRPEHMADAILYLLSESSAFVTGAELTVDGGRGAD